MTHNQLGLGLFDSGKFGEAEECFHKALSMDPKFVAAHNNLGSLYKAMGRVGEALSSFELSLTLDPSSHKTRWNRALTLLAAGDMERGWRHYEARWESPETPPRQLAPPRWQGEPLEGKSILLYPEQGLGDTIQFIRYAEHLKDRGATVIFECPSPLAGVCKRARNIDVLLTEGEPLPPFDYHAPLLSLPRLFGTLLENIPARVPYIDPDPAQADRWHQWRRSHIPDGLAIGLAWQGNPHHQWDHFRSIPLQEFEPLARESGIHLVSLQRGPGIEQIEPFQKLTGSKLLVPTSGLQTGPEHLEETAALMAALDLVVAVDTAPAHLAGALARPTWTLISTVADWRWLLDRADSPWYPTMRLLRQKTFGEWEHPIQQAVRLLREMR